MVASVFIDGQAGTTGLRIRDLLGPRRDLHVLEIGEQQRKDPAARRALFERADVALLCLPDDAARESVALCADLDTRVVDASTAHRVADGWVYGLPELEADQRERIAAARFVSNPGCWPTGVLLLLRPLIDAGLIAPDAPIAVHGVFGYTGGGKRMIERWQEPELVGLPYEVPYALDCVHKHVPEMTHYSGFASAPQLRPSVAPFDCGMRIEIPLHAALLAGPSAAKRIQEALEARYARELFISVLPPSASQSSDEQCFDPRHCNHSNRIELRAIAHPSGHVLLMAVLDNLGKGAAGAAVQNLNLMLGLPEGEGLLV